MDKMNENMLKFLAALYFSKTEVIRTNSGNYLVNRSQIKQTLDDYKIKYWDRQNKIFVREL